MFFRLGPGRYNERQRFFSPISNEYPTGTVAPSRYPKYQDTARTPSVLPDRARRVRQLGTVLENVTVAHPWIHRGRAAR